MLITALKKKIIRFENLKENRITKITKIIFNVIDIEVSQNNEICYKYWKVKNVNYMTICLVIHIRQPKPFRNNKYT